MSLEVASEFKAYHEMETRPVPAKAAAAAAAPLLREGSCQNTRKDFGISTETNPTLTL